MRLERECVRVCVFACVCAPMGLLSVAIGTESYGGHRWPVRGCAMVQISNLNTAFADVYLRAYTSVVQSDSIKVEIRPAVLF